jgi:VanZ family protein
MNTLRWPRFWLGLWIVGMLLGCYLSLRPGSEKIPIIPHLDKLIHATSYALLAVLAVCLFKPGRNRWLAVLWLVLLGGLIEIAQGLWAVNRAADPWDLLANSLGIVLGAAIFWRRNLLAHIESVWPR